MTQARKLSDKQEKFCQEYLVDQNASQAAKRAGYSKKTAEKQGSQLLANPRVAARVRFLRDKQHKRIQLNADTVLNEMASLAMVQVDHFSDWDGENFSIKAYRDMHPIALKAIKSIKVTHYDNNMKTVVDSEGNEVTTKDRTTTMEVKLHSKDKALEMLGKYYKILDGGEDSPDSELDDALNALEEEETKKIESQK